MPERVIRTLDGKRGSFLLLSGLFYILIGLTYEVVSTPTRSAAFQWLPEAMTPQVLGVVWLVGGGASVVIALVSRWASRLERVAFAALMFCPLVWTLIFVGATIMGTHPNGWLSGVMYGFFASTVWVVAGWDNPTPPATGPIRTIRGTDE